MAGQGIDRVEAVLSAVSKMTLGEERTVHEANCPECNASDFVDLPDLYTEAAGRLYENPDQGNVAHVGGIPDAQIVARFGPPPRRSPVIRVVLIALPAAAAAGYVYHRFGPIWGQLAFIGAGIVALVVFLTTLRKFSDEYYDRRAQWRRRYLCRRCGHLIET